MSMITEASDSYHSRWLRLPLSLFVGLSVLNIVGVAAGNTIVEWLTKPLLMPLLIWFLAVVRQQRKPLAATDRRVGSATPLILALMAATIADVALLIPGVLAFGVGMGFFAIMQLGYISSLWPLGVADRWRQSPWIPLSYLGLWVGFTLFAWPRLGGLAPAIAVYGLLLCGMAAVALGAGGRLGPGGAAFVLSDLMIGLGIVGIDVPFHGAAIMTTYLAAQFLLITGWFRRTAGETLSRS